MRASKGWSREMRMTVSLPSFGLKRKVMPEIPTATLPASHCRIGSRSSSDATGCSGSSASRSNVGWKNGRRRGSVSILTSPNSGNPFSSAAASSSA